MNSILKILLLDFIIFRIKTNEMKKYIMNCRLVVNAKVLERSDDRVGYTKVWNYTCFSRREV